MIMSVTASIICVQGVAPPADLHDTQVTSRHQPPVMSLGHRSMIVDPPPFLENMYMDESKYRNEC